MQFDGVTSATFLLVTGVRAVVSRLAQGASGKTEAEIQADVRALLLQAPFEIESADLLDVTLEAQTETGKRIDVEAGCAVIEVKKDLGSGAAAERALLQLGGYVRQRTEERSDRYVGVLTDGRSWILYHLDADAGELSEVSRFALRGAEDSAALCAWLETVLATKADVEPTPASIIERLGAGSPAAQLDLADLAALYEACRDDPEVQLKRELWARLLLSALGTSFEDSDELFVVHTYLVLTAELIAHEVMGLPTAEASGDARALLEGQQFAMAGLHGVVEADFFDWPAVSSQGQPIIAAIARRLSRFDWSEVHHDILKTLYESVIDTETRHRLGEYYTPDWLAEKIVAEHLVDPLSQRMLDPACGSGTFLFWSVRRVLASCDAAGMSNQEAIEHVVQHVQGMDLHPVAVTLARVTYLLALTPRRLRDRDELTVPVFLGDSVRWEQDDTVLTDQGMTVMTADPMQLVGDELHFPEGVLEEPRRFDRLVADLATKASDRPKGRKPPGIKGLLNRHGVAEADRAAVTLSFEKLCRLHDAGRDHVWSYYIRNLVRPLTFTRAQGQVDLLLGNPPWLPYRSMPPKLKSTYKALARERGLWAGGKVATQQDLSDLFVVRAIEQYLRPEGNFAFVMPFAVLSREQYDGFRSASWERKNVPSTVVQFGPFEEFARVKPPLFGVPACLVSGTKQAPATSMPTRGVSWRGQLGSDSRDWEEASALLSSGPAEIEAGHEASDSPYKSQFRQGANFVPRMLVTVAEAESPLGTPKGTRRVRSARSSAEKKPWKSLESLEMPVEDAFVSPLHLGATIVSFRARPPKLAILPRLNGAVVGEDDENLDEFPGIAKWWRRAETLWAEKRSASTKLSLAEQLDYQSKLSHQFPIPPRRVVYAKSGQYPAACIVDDPTVVIDHTLYWGAVATLREGRYLCAILNSEVLAEAVKGLQARGQHNPRHFDLKMFAAPFPIFDGKDDLHLALAELAQRAEAMVAGLDLDQHGRFEKARAATREALREHGLAAELNEAVIELIEGPRAPSGPAAPDLMEALSQAEQGARPTRRGGRRKGRTPSKRATQGPGRKQAPRQRTRAD